MVIFYFYYFEFDDIWIVVKGFGISFMCFVILEEIVGVYLFRSSE